MNRAPMRVLVAPDSFKGSLSAPEFCAIAGQVFATCLPGSEVAGLPMADGGEGTAEALVRGTAGKMRSLTVSGPLGETVEANYGLLGDGVTAVVEMAQASGLPLVPPDRLDPLRATSYGTGELIAKVLEQGAEHIILALGGSATNDGGMGALRALGFAFLDRAGSPVEPNGGALEEIASVVAERVHPRLGTVSITIASDVTNPLLGKRGATTTYGPQKGADAQALQRLERGLTRFAEVTTEFNGSDHRDTPGAGAAGGMGFGFLSYAGAALCSGFEVVAEAYALDRRLEQGCWDLILTGEGRVDVQSIQGKLVGRIAELGNKYRIPVVVLAGAVQGDISELYRGGVTSVSSIVTGPMQLEQAMQQAPLLLRRRLIDLCNLLQGIS